MSLALLEPPTNTTPERALKLSQQAPAFLKSQSTWSLPYPLSLFSANESQEKWQSYENVLLACLRAGDFESASKCLEDLTKRFGVENDRVLALRGLYKEAKAKDQQELNDILKQYNDILEEDPTVFAIWKRKIALLRSMGKTAEAVTALTNLLDVSPIDAEAWSELSDLYVSQGALEQAVFCLEEVLLIAPNAWNMHARLGEVLFLSASREDAGEQPKLLSESMRRFCRSIELCDNYLRGYYGLKLTTKLLLEVIPNAKSVQRPGSEPVKGELALPSIDSVKKLNERATAKLAEILRRSSLGEKDWDGYSPTELKAARALLDRDSPAIAR